MICTVEILTRINRERHIAVDHLRKYRLQKCLLHRCEARKSVEHEHCIRKQLRIRHKPREILHDLLRKQVITVNFL